MEQSNQHTFHGVPFVLTMTVEDSSKLIVEAEQEDSNERWLGEFPAQYLEEITGKTGNFKRFDVFVKMLASALAGNSESVFVDLLTYQDLERLKARKSGKPPSQNSKEVSKGSSKRFLILTYVVEFDRVHYPLPLAYESQANPQTLLRTITRLKKELARNQKNTEPVDLASSYQQEAQTTELKKEFKRIVSENEQLKLQLIRAKAKSSPSTAQESRDNWDSGMDREKEALRSKLSALSTQLKEERHQHRSLQVRYRKEVGRLKAGLEREQAAARALRTRCQQLQRQVEARGRAPVAAAAARSRSAGPRRASAGSSVGGSGGRRRGRRSSSARSTPGEPAPPSRPAWGAGPAARSQPAGGEGARRRGRSAGGGGRRNLGGTGYDTPQSGYSSAGSAGSRASRRSGWSSDSRGSARSRASSVHSRLARGGGGGRGPGGGARAGTPPPAPPPSGAAVRRRGGGSSGKKGKGARRRTPSPGGFPRPKPAAASPDTNHGVGERVRSKKVAGRQAGGSARKKMGAAADAPPGRNGSFRSSGGGRSVSSQGAARKGSGASGKKMRRKEGIRRGGSARAKRPPAAGSAAQGLADQLISENIVLGGNPVASLGEYSHALGARGQGGSPLTPEAKGDDGGKPVRGEGHKNGGTSAQDLSTALEISDIDQRLNALQDFLKKAKSGMLS